MKWKNNSIEFESYLSWRYWALPLAVYPEFGKFNAELVTKADGTVDFVKIKSKGWYFEFGVRFLCLYFSFEFNRWY